jgi:hypothetical protein
MAPEVGLEPTTTRLTAACSTIELLWNPKRRRNLQMVVRRVNFDFLKSYFEKIRRPPLNQSILNSSMERYLLYQLMIL